MRLAIDVKSLITIKSDTVMSPVDFFVEGDHLKIVSFEDTFREPASFLKAQQTARLQKEVLRTFGKKRDYPIKESRFQNLQRFYSSNLRGTLSTYENEIHYLKGDFLSNTEISVTMHFTRGHGRNRVMIPYIPGSTIRGAIRTAILYHFNNADKSETGEDRCAIRGIEKEKDDKKIFPQLYSKGYGEKDGGKIDLLSFIQVTDFLPEGNNFRLGIHKLIRNTRIRNRNKRITKTVLGVESGTFIGEIKIKKSLINFIRGSTLQGTDEQIRRLSEILGVDNLDSLNFKDQISESVEGMLKEMEVKVVKGILLKLKNYYNSEILVRSKYSVRGLDEETPLVIGFGKGRLLNSICREKIEYSEEGIGETPTTFWYVDKEGKERPGVCYIREVEK